MNPTYEIRKRLGMSLDDLGHIMGFTRHTIAKYEQMEDIPPWWRFALIGVLSATTRDQEDYLDQLVGNTRNPHTR